MSLDEALVGRRVVVRSRVPGETGPSGGPAMTDVLGVVDGIDDQAIVVRRRDGTVVRLPRSDIVALKEIPPPPPPRSPR